MSSVHINTRPFPAGYQPLWKEHQFDRALAIAAHHTHDRYGLTPLGGTVGGSRLRGLDHGHSDTDTLVLVSEKIPRAVQLQISRDHEVEIQGVDRFAKLIGTSVPYLEAHRSPYLQIVPEWAPFIRSLRINEHQFEFHAHRYAQHLVTRKATKAHPEKVLRQLAGVHHIIHYGHPMVPRDHPTSPGFLSWVHATFPDMADFFRKASS